jgi:putative methionine-R-sulfoxide reductase with GAF domain
MRHRPTELKAVADLLEREHESVDDLAQELLDLLVDIKWKRGAYCVVVYQFGNVFTYGPFANKAEATRAVGKEIVAGEVNARGAIVRVRDMTEMRETLGLDSQGDLLSGV